MPQTRQCGCWRIGLFTLCSLASWLVWSSDVGLLPEGLDPRRSTVCSTFLNTVIDIRERITWNKLHLFFLFFLSMKEFCLEVPSEVSHSSGSYCSLPFSYSWSEQLTLIWIQKESIQASVSYVHTHKSCVTPCVKCPDRLIWELCFLLLGHPLALCVRARPFPLFCIFPVEKLMRNHSWEDVRPMTAGTKGVFVRALHHGARGTTDGAFEVMMGWWTQQ